MNPTRRLALRRETLTELTADELTFAAGAAPTLKPGCSEDEIRDYLREVQLKLTLHPHCSWSCI
jgi:hypothetical protein